jgi:hypothetical protein
VICETLSEFRFENQICFSLNESSSDVSQPTKLYLKLGTGRIFSLKNRSIMLGYTLFLLSNFLHQHYITI